MTFRRLHNLAFYILKYLFFVRIKHCRRKYKMKKLFSPFYCRMGKFITNRTGQALPTARRITGIFHYFFAFRELSIAPLKPSTNTYYVPILLSLNLQLLTNTSIFQYLFSPFFPFFLKKHRTRTYFTYSTK